MHVLKTILYGFAIPLIALLLTSCPNPHPDQPGDADHGQ